METENKITLQTLLDCGVSARGVGDGGLTPVQFAARTGRVGMMGVLLSKGEYGIDVNASAADRPTALIYAARSGSQEILRMLLGHPRIEVNQLGPEGYSALHWAILREHVHTVELLITDPRVDLSTRTGTIVNALMRAVSTGNQEIVELLLRNPGIDVSDRGLDGRTALHIAAVRAQNEAIVRMLVQDLRVDICIQDYMGHTPLSVARCLNDDNILALLVDEYANWKQIMRRSASRNMTILLEFSRRFFIYDVDNSGK
ncbi:ankyrin repeat-containing domain protein [Tuber brumale]|nr:ankyrin repeat-containing domain protein [Tuber brumale]